jgi:hypothetical protein
LLNGRALPGFQFPASQKLKQNKNTQKKKRKVKQDTGDERDRSLGVILYRMMSVEWIL